MKLSPDFFADELTTLEDYLAAVQATLKTGVMPDMTGFQDRVGTICHRLQKAEKDVQQQFLQRLTSLLAKLDACEADLHVWQAAANNDGKQES